MNQFLMFVACPLITDQLSLTDGNTTTCLDLTTDDLLQILATTMPQTSSCIVNGKLEIKLHAGSSLLDNGCGIFHQIVFSDGTDRQSCSRNSYRSCSVINPGKKGPFCFMQCQCKTICTLRLMHI